MRFSGRQWNCGALFLFLLGCTITQAQEPQSQQAVVDPKELERFLQSPVPGTTAQGGLKHDVLYALYAKAKGDAPACLVEVMGAERVLVEAAGGIEYWTVKRCDAPVRYVITFSIKPAGGTYFEIKDWYPEGKTPTGPELRIEFDMRKKGTEL